MDYPRFSSVPRCAETDPDLWFNVGTERGYRELNLLKAICKNCEVREECYNYALNHAVDGFWAGKTPKEFQRIRSKLGIRPIPMYSDLP